METYIIPLTPYNICDCGTFDTVPPTVLRHARIRFWEFLLRQPTRQTQLLKLLHLKIFSKRYLVRHVSIILPQRWQQAPPSWCVILLHIIIGAIWHVKWMAKHRPTESQLQIQFATATWPTYVRSLLTHAKIALGHAWCRRFSIDDIIYGHSMWPCVTQCRVLRWGTGPCRAAPLTETRHREHTPCIV